MEPPSSWQSDRRDGVNPRMVKMIFVKKWEDRQKKPEKDCSMSFNICVTIQV